ncbi:MAG: helix-turn-helix transcriptional regulator, partial [Atopobiaceae bacterium]|nr:helix-turn-helix transcriptional regulator [Atopobiaceae bacterium]
MMDRYLTGATIKALREKCGMTQAQLAGKLNVSGKAVSKWETGAGYPDITLLEPIAAALRTSVSELLAGASVQNSN